MGTYIKISLAVFIGMFLLNMIIHGFFVVPTITRPLLGDIVRSQQEMNYLPMLVNYLLLSLGLTYLAIHWGERKSYRDMAIFGFLVGFLLFLNFGLVALFVLPHWPLTVAIVDAITTGVIWMVLAILIQYLRKKWVVPLR